MATIVTVVNSSGSYRPQYSWGPFPHASYLYVVTIDGLTGQVLIYRSADTGATWTLYNSSGPVVNSSFGRPAVVQDGDLLRVVYFVFVSSLNAVEHRSIDLSTGTWSSAVTSSEQIEMTQSPVACVFGPGGIFVAYAKKHSVGGVTESLTVVQVFNGASWNAAQTIKDTSSDYSIPLYCCPANDGGVHFGLRAGSPTLGSHYVKFSTSETFGTVYSGPNGRVALAFVSGSTEYIAVAFFSPADFAIRCAISALAVPPVWTLKTIYTRNASTEQATGAGAFTLVRSGKSLHCIFWWRQNTAPLQRLRKSCLPFADAAASWSTATEIATASDNTAVMSGYMEGSQSRIVYSRSDVTSANYVRFFTEDMVSCAGPDCCCYDFAY